MEYSSEWWGVWLIAKTQEEKDLLVRLVSKIPDNARGAYDQGEIRFHSGLEWLSSKHVVSPGPVDNDDLVLVFGR